MVRQKRKLEVVDLCGSSPEASPKRSRIPLHSLADASKTPLVVIDDDDDDDLQLILQQIKEQEESEALAKRMQDGPSSQLSHHTGLTDNENVQSVEDDTALAKRLAAEWAEEDRGPRRMSPTADASSSSSTLHSTLAYNPDLMSDDVTPEAQLSEYKDLFAGERACSHCGNPVPSPRGYLAFTSATIPPPKLSNLLHAICSSCKTSHCRGCFKPISCLAKCNGSSKCPVLTCCAELRAIAIFETLGAFDRLTLGQRSMSESRAQENLAKTKARYTSTVGPGGTGYGMGDWDSASDYGCGRGRGRHNSTSQTPTRTDELAQHFEDLVSRALQTLTYLFPSPYSDTAQPYDFLPHASVGPLITMSQLPEVLGGLLRNDSVTDWTKRLATYQAMLDLLRRMADCEVTLRRLIEPRWEIKKSCGIEDWIWGDGAIVWEQKSNGGGIIRGVPLYSHFQKLTKQSEAFLAGAIQMMDGEGADGEVDETMVKMTSLCGDIIAARDDIQRTMGALGCTDRMDLVDEHVPSGPTEPDARNGKATGGGKGKGKTKSSLEQASRTESMTLEQAYARACERLSFKYVMLADPGDGGLVWSFFKYAKDVISTANATRTPKDRMHLVKELAVMATSLPPGIWVRVDEVRNDVLKILIAGPEGTPYAGGLFEFDCFMPLQYPREPPKMHLRTTGNGKVRFNPNLYESGKVCLSLLGTWPGRPEEQWSPYKSTLLQVLVSIQSMILIDLPWFNEPGRGPANAKNKGSIAFNRQISLHTVTWAMLDWLQETHRHGIWADVITTHFILRREQIREQIVQWAEKEAKIRAYKGRLYSSRYAVSGSRQGTSPTTIDLLEEFDNAVGRIKEWDISEKRLIPSS